MRDVAIVGAALAVSVALVFFVSGSGLIALSFAGGLALLGLVAFVGARYRPHRPGERDGSELDWSVTLTAIEQPGLAVAITDRANRLVCATAAYQESFGTSAPPRLDVDEESADLLVRTARTAWREADGGEGVVIGGKGGRWLANARTAGLAEDFLVWRFTPVDREATGGSSADQLAGLVSAEFGRMLGRTGICAALVDGDGMVGAANPAFARGAGGESGADLTGQALVSLLRTDERERIYFARDGRHGAPQILIEVPLTDPAAAKDDEAAPATLMLLFDRGVGLGGWDADDLQQSPQLEALIERLPLGLAAVNRDGRFLFANPAFRRAAGLTGMQAGGDLPPYPSDLVARADKTAIADAVRRYALGAAAGGDITVRLAANSEEPVSIGLTGVRGLGEVAVLLSIADTTEENRLKRQVAQATKMQAVGQLAGGVAHDFNNVLTAIIGTCDLMQLRHAPGDADYDDIQQIKANSNRAASLTRQLLAFSRQQTLKPEIIQLPDVVSEVTNLLKRLLGARIALKVHHDRDLGFVRADPGQLEQVIMNLAVNARDAIQEHGGGEQATGTLSFATRHVDADDIRRMDSEIIPPGDYTVLVVEDTGGGIPRRVMAKIFEPFFTTKEQGKGTGLGLSTVYGIVKQSGGFIFAENVQDGAGGGRGARFTVYLPVYAATAEELRRAARPAEDAPPAKAREWSGGGRVLLVEDEDMVRAVAERALARAGYAVVTARDGEEGLEAFRAGMNRGAAFDLVVSDVVMPGMDGPALARVIRQEAPDVPVLFMSGYAEAQLREEIDIETVHFIAKPFSLREIADKVSEVMAAPRRR